MFTMNVLALLQRMMIIIITITIIAITIIAISNKINSYFQMPLLGILQPR